MPGKTWRSVQWEQWFLTPRQISTLGAVTVLNTPSVWAVGINDLYLRECEKSQSKTDLAIPLPLSWRARSVLSECSRPSWCLHKPTANFLPRLLICPVQWSDPWNAQSVLSSKDQHTSGLNINKAVGNIQLTEESGNWELWSHFPETSTGTPTPRRGRDRALKDGSSQHAAYQQGVKRNTETNHGLGCSLQQLLEQHHQREAVLQREWCSSAQPQWDRHSLTSAALTPSIQTPSHCSRWTLTWKLAFNFHIETAILQLKHNVNKPN